MRASGPMPHSSPEPAAAWMAIVASAWLAAVQPAAAQPRVSSTGGIYTCIDDQGRRLTSDRPIAACSAKEQQILNTDGSVRGIHPPTLTAEEKAAVEARERKASAERMARIEDTRRDKNLLARYPNEAAHRKAREAALESVRLAIKATEERMKVLQAERKPLDNEVEFYKGKPLPPKLRAQIEANDTAVEAQKEATASQQAELERVNRIYDTELARLQRLWAGAAPGSMGPLPTPGSGNNAAAATK